MKSATVFEIKDELLQLPPVMLVDLCLRLVKFKKENKELLTYLLFEAHDIDAYIGLVKTETSEAFTEINSSNLYFAKKTIRKILRNINKYIRYTGSKQAEIELLLFYCRTLKESGIPFQKSPALVNLYEGQLKKIKKAIDTLHEDLQYDYNRELEAME
jgi:hypothetical protein